MKLVAALVALSVPNVASAHHGAVTKTGAPVGWCQDVVEYEVDARTEAKLGAYGMAALRRAGSAWLGVDGVPVISIVSEAGAVGPARAHVEWIDDWAGFIASSDSTETINEETLAVTVNTYVNKTGNVEYSALSINGTERWSLLEGEPLADAYDFESVMVHEFGHALGLDHLDDKQSVMYPKGYKGYVWREPGHMDIDALEQHNAGPRNCAKRTVRSEMAAAPSCSASGTVRKAFGGTSPVLMAFCAVLLMFVQRRFFGGRS